MFKSVLSACFLLVAVAAYTQSADPSKDILPPSPTAAALTKFVDFPVNASTGTPSIGIQLGVLTGRGITVPISLDYHASGVKSMFGFCLRHKKGNRCVTCECLNHKFMRLKFEKLTDSQWQVMAKFLPVQRKRSLDLRKVVDAIRWLNETGCQWRNLPESFPPWTAVYYYFRRWKSDGTLNTLNIGLNMIERQAWEKEPTPSLVCVDSQSVKSVPFVKNDKGIDANKRVNGRKRQVLVDTLGLVWGVIVHPANEHDSVAGGAVLRQLQNVFHDLEQILIDKAYQGSFCQTAREVFGVTPEVSSKPPSTKGFVPVKWRWVSERTFAWFNFFRRLSKDYEKTKESSEAWLFWANCQMILAKW